MATKKKTKKRASKKDVSKRLAKKTTVKKTAAGKKAAKKAARKKRPATFVVVLKYFAAADASRADVAVAKDFAIAMAPVVEKFAEIVQSDARGKTELSVPSTASRDSTTLFQQPPEGPTAEIPVTEAPVTDAPVTEQERPAEKSIAAAPKTSSGQTSVAGLAVPKTGTSDNTPVIFLAFANDRDDTIGYLRNLPIEARRLREVLEPAEQAGLCEVVVRSNSTAGDIFKVFQDPRYRNRVAILHYGGHANGYELLLESAAGEAAVADAGGLAKFLGQQQGLHLVFLNGCSTQQQTEGLLEANVSAVISTSRAIEDQVATDFSYQFYQGLAGGTSIRTAYNEAEASVQTSKGGNTRGLYFGAKDKEKSPPETDRWPWNLYLREGSETADQWNLPEAVNDPLFGLPSLPELDLPESPYRHLNWFTKKDAEVFFGRGHQIRELYDRLTAPRTAPIMLFYGQSGVGKSSILDAGLLPRLEQHYEVRYLRRGEGGLLDTLRKAFSPESADVPIETAWLAKEQQSGKPLIVFLDQVEELYTRPVADMPDELDQLLKMVRDTFCDPNQRPKGKLVLGFRKEWLAELEAQLVAYELPRTKVFLEPLDRRGIIEIVRGPARTARLSERYGLTVEDGLAENIADDLLADRDSAIAPTLQILLTKMWAKATDANYEHPEFSQELYQQLKHDGILMRDFLNQQIAAFRKQYPEAVDSGLLLDLVALHTTPLGTADQRTVVQLQEQYAHLGVMLPKVLQQCQDLHLLTVAANAQKESTKTTRLAHDTLAPLVREQFEVSDKPGQRARRILNNRSVDWAGDQTGTPLDEADLKLVEQGEAGTRALNETEQRLVEASRVLRAKLKRMRTIVKIAGSVAVAIIAITAGVALWQRNEAITAKEQAFEARNRADTNRALARELMSDLVPEVTESAAFSDTVKKELAVQTREYFQEFVTKHSKDPKDEARTRRVLADAEYVIGRIYRETKNFDDAIKAYETARGWQCKELKITRGDIGSLRVRSDNEGLVNDLGYTLNALGETYRLQGNDLDEKEISEANFLKAKDRFSEAVLIRKKVTEFRPEDVNYQLLHASSVMNIGLALRGLKDFDSARQYYENADKIRRDLLGAVQDKADRLTIEWHIALGNMNLAALTDDGEKKEALATEGINFAKAQSKGDIFIQNVLANLYILRGNLKLDKFDLGELPLEETKLVDDAIDDYKEAAVIYMKLFEDRPWNPRYQTQLTDFSFYFEDLYPKLNDEPETLSKVGEFLKSIQDFNWLRVKEDVAHEVENVGRLTSFGDSALQYVKLCVETKNWAVAREQLDTDVRFWRGLVEKEFKDPEYRDWVHQYLADFLVLNVQALQGFTKYAEAEKAKQDALDLWKGLSKKWEANAEVHAFCEEQHKTMEELKVQPPAGESG
jgi:tetratricopeptide (TPR) repeat protein